MNVVVPLALSAVRMNFHVFAPNPGGAKPPSMSGSPEGS